MSSSCVLVSQRPCYWLAEMSAYSRVPVDTGNAARDLQDRVARLGAAIFIMALLMGIASVATHVVSGGAGTEA